MLAKCYLLSPGCSPPPKMKFCIYWTSPQHCTRTSPPSFVSVPTIVAVQVPARADHISPALELMCRSGFIGSCRHSTFQSLRNLQAAFYIASFYVLRLKFLWTPISCFFYSNCQSNGCLAVVFIYISLMVSDVNHLFLMLGFIGHLLSFIFLLRHLC